MGSDFPPIKKVLHIRATIAPVCLPAHNAAGRFDAGFPGRFSPLAAKEPCPYRQADEFFGTMPDCYFSGLFPA